MSVADLIAAHRTALTPAERRVADVVLEHPQTVAFGTVAGVAERATTSGATVVRLAAKIGLEGFSGLQSKVQEELSYQLRPAAERIRDVQVTDAIGRALALELDNVQATLEAADAAAVDGAVRLLTRLDRAVHVLPGEASRGVGLLLVDQLGMLRPRVGLLGGSTMALSRDFTDVHDGDTVVIIDFRRHERWVLTAAEQLRRLGAGVVALTDSALSPLAEGAAYTFFVRADGVGPFDSNVGTLALVNALVAAAAARLQSTAAHRLDRIEAVWKITAALEDA